MELKRGYKQTEVGVIPEEWEVPHVGDVCGCIVPGRNKPKLFDGDIPWITTPDLEAGKPVTTSRLDLCISRAEAKSVGSKVVPPGSVLMSCAGELGIVAITQNEIVVNQQLHVFLPTARIDATYLLSALSYRKDQIAGLGTKTAVPYLNKNSCNSIPIPLPPLPEQRAIAAALSDVDALLGRLDRLIAKKRDLKQAAMQQLLTGQTRLPDFHGVWEVRLFGSLVERTFTKSSLSSGDGLKSGSFPLFVSGGEPKRTEIAQFQDAEALVFSDGGVFGVRHAVGRFSVTDHCFVVALRKEIADMRWFEAWFSLDSKQMDRLAFKGSGLRNLDKPSLRGIEIRSPDLDEQTAIAVVLSDMDAEIEMLKKRRDKTRDLKQAMMQELLTGKTRLVIAGDAHA